MSTSISYSAPAEYECDFVHQGVPLKVSIKKNYFGRYNGVLSQTLLNGYSGVLATFDGLTFTTEDYGKSEDATQRIDHETQGRYGKAYYTDFLVRVSNFDVAIGHFPATLCVEFNTKRGMLEIRNLEGFCK